MAELTIAQSVLESVLVGIGRARVGKVSEGLLTRLGEKISDYQQNLHCPFRGSKLNLAAKAAAEMKWGLEFSWAVTDSNLSATAHEAALLHCYKGRFGWLPGFKRPDNGKFVRGNKVLPSAERSVGSLTWSPWRPMEKQYFSDLPKKPGVYRIRAAPPA